MKRINSIKRIEVIENTATFKSFIVRVGCHNFSEYMKFFGDNLLMRKVATDWCVETYPDLFSKNLLEGKQQKS